MRAFIVTSTLVGVVCITALAGGPTKIDVPKAIGILKNATNPKDRIQAAEDIGRRGGIRVTDVKEAIDPLLDALKKDRDAGVRSAAAKALGEIATEPDKTVPSLIDALNDKAVNVKMSAATALGQFGPQAKSALPALRELVKDKKDKKLSKSAAAAVKKIVGAKK
jgi:hypothetical protein